MKPSNIFAPLVKRMDDLERLVKADRSAPIRNASIDGPVTISHRGQVATTAADGTATRLADGVAEVQSGPGEPWVTLEQVILEQVPPPSDGNPPATAPGVELIPGVGTVFVKIVPPPNADPITGFTVYVDGVAGPTSASSLISVSLDATGQPLPYDADTTFAVSASDVDGEGPLSAPLSARPIKVAPGDLAQTIIDQIDAAGSAAVAAQASADGKSTIFYSGGNPPADGAPGYAVGDSWVKFTGGNLVGRWVHNGTGFRSEIIPDAMIGNLDAAKIDTGFLNVAILIEAGAISVDKIDADLIEVSEIYGRDGYFGQITAENLASIITFSTLFRTAETGQRGEWDVDSLRFYNSDGAQTTRLSGEDSFFAGNAQFANLGTESATLGGVTVGAPGGTFRLSSTILVAPGVPLDHMSEPVARVALPDAGKAVFTDTVATYRWRMADGVGSLRLKRYSAAGALQSDTAFGGPVATEQYRIDSAAMSDSMLYALFTSPNGSQNLIRWDRSAPTTHAGLVGRPAAPGTGGYAAGEPVIGVQRTTGHVLLAHRVQGAQTIGSQPYVNNEVMVRRYAPGSGMAAIGALAQTIKTDLPAGGTLTSVLMDNVSGTFDMPALSGNTALVVSAKDPGIGGFGVGAQIVGVPNTGAVVAAGALPLTGVPAGWYGSGVGLLYDGTSFWATRGAGSELVKFGNSPVAAPSTFHGYTYWDGTRETTLSPVIERPIFGRHISRWSIPKLPAGVTQVRIYEASANTRTRFARVGTFTGAPGEPLQIIQNPIAPPAGTSSTPPPATSDFTGGASYVMEDGLGNTWTGGYLTVRDPTMPTDVANMRFVNAGGTPGSMIDLTLGTGYAHSAARTQAQLRAGYVTLAISATKTTIPAGDVVCTLPVGMRPPRTLYFQGMVAATVLNMQAEAGGAVRCNTAASGGVNATLVFAAA